MAENFYATSSYADLTPLHSPGAIGEVIREIQKIENPSDEARGLKEDLYDLEQEFSERFFGRVEWLYVTEVELSKWELEPDELKLILGYKKTLANLLSKAELIAKG